MSVKIWPLEFNKEDYIELFKEAVNDDVALNVVTGIKRNNIVKETVKAVKEIAATYKLDYSDIAILYPNKDNKGLRYYIQHWVKMMLDENNIPYAITQEREDGMGVTISNNKGVVVAPIDEIAGLEFKAVILTGLYPCSYAFDGNEHRIKLKDWESACELREEERAVVENQIAKIYKAYCRANEVLYVLSDAETGTIIDDIVVSSEEKQIDQYVDSIFDDILKCVAI